MQSIVVITLSCFFLHVDVKKHPGQLPSNLKLEECYQQDEGESFCSCRSTCSGQTGMIIGTLREQGLRLVTNLTKLRPARSMTQQDVALRPEAIMLGLPTGNSKGHKAGRVGKAPGECSGANHPVGVEGHGYNNPGPIKV